MPYLEGAGELDALPPLREVLERAGPRRVRVEVDDRAVLGDFDTPADLSMFGGVNPQFFADRRL
jgi:CTP:molybdopterin cytidylyltransferase MocA